MSPTLYLGKISRHPGESAAPRLARVITYSSGGVRAHDTLSYPLSYSRVMLRINKARYDLSSLFFSSPSFNIVSDLPVTLVLRLV